MRAEQKEKNTARLAFKNELLKTLAPAHFSVSFHETLAPGRLSVPSPLCLCGEKNMDSSKSGGPS